MLSTLPELAQSWGYSLDGLRLLIRKDPGLRALGKWFGSARAYDQQEAAAIKSAYEARKPRRTAPTAV